MEGHTGQNMRKDEADERVTLAEIALEREKMQIERDRLALERERWSVERDKRQSDMVLQDRAAGRVTMGISTLTLALLAALLAGGTVGAWVVASHDSRANSRVTASLIKALGSGTNETDMAGSSALLRALGRPGRGGGYLLILD
ncbi:MAG: hypothetical protein PHR35_19465 [Kiritimatiellae bacterium]|nr:hypothetical protein [Kiritimatiellia bacterium]